VQVAYWGIGFALLVLSQLEKQGNFCSDWSKLKVAQDFKPDFIRQNFFQGKCILGLFTGKPVSLEEGISLPSGIYESTIIDAEIGSECLVYQCKLVANYLICEGSILFNISSLWAGQKLSFGNGLKIPVGIETGGREVLSFAEMDIQQAALVALNRANFQLQEIYAAFVKDYCQRLTIDFGIILGGSVVKNTVTIKNSLLGERVLIDSANLIENTTVLSCAGEQTEISHGAIVSNSCIQWGCQVTSLAIVKNSVMTEHSHAERHGKITASIIGPNTGIAEGEVTSALLGPFVGFHHQAMLIAAIWPEGKGNIAYGANVGSNHTSRAPDQEIFCGEGVFFGLGTNIKLPANFAKAPYSIIATGVTTLPQKVEFPFSLIMNPSEIADELPMFVNEIVPAWVLSDNIYALRRNEAKYKKRNKARRTNFDFTVFRPEIIEFMLKARDRLNAVVEIKNRYTEKDIPGLGRNFLYEYKRLRAIQAYNFYLEFYCLNGLIEELFLKAGIPKEADCMGEAYGKEVLKHKLDLLTREGYANRDYKTNILRYCEMLSQIAEDVLKTKAKDDKRGGLIIDDYAEAHTPAFDDEFVRQTMQEAEQTIKKIKEVAGLS